MQNQIQGARGGVHPSLKFIDVNEQYGRHIIEHFAQNIGQAEVVCDLGAGIGEDLLRFKKYHKDAKLFGVDFTDKLKDDLARNSIALQIKDIEKEALDFENESVDVFIANQLFEHIKEIFWLNDQIAGKLKVGGYLIIGLPNLSSLHNRILFLLGKQPTQLKTYSAHIRGFSHNEIVDFFKVCFPGGYELIEKKGSQFYPFPKFIARFLSMVFPGLAFSNFYLFKKVKKYNGEFLKHPVEARLETNFFIG